MAKNLTSEFVKFYKDKLAQYGFKKVKGRQPYFVRLVNDEIIQLLTFVPGKSAKIGYKEFILCCGVATVYRKELNFDVPPSHNGDWLIDYDNLMKMRDSYYIEPTGVFHYNYYNDDNIIQVLEDTEEDVKCIIEQLDKVRNMQNALLYFLKYNSTNVIFEYLLTDDFCDEEGLYYAMKEFDSSLIEKELAQKKEDLKNIKNIRPQLREIFEKEHAQYEQELLENLHKCHMDDTLCREGKKILAERREKNLEVLRKYEII